MYMYESLEGKMFHKTVKSKAPELSWEGYCQASDKGLDIHFNRTLSLGMWQEGPQNSQKKHLLFVLLNRLFSSQDVLL